MTKLPLRPPASPPSSFPATSYQPNWTPSNSSGGILVKDPDDWRGATFGVFILIGIPFILFLAFVASQSSKPSNPPPSRVWSGSSSSSGYRPNFGSSRSGSWSPDNPFGSSPGFRPSSPSVAPTAEAIETARGILPSSVQKLPVSAFDRRSSSSSAGYRSRAEFSPDGRWVAYSDAQNVVRVWDRRARRAVHTLPQAKDCFMLGIDF